MEHGTFLGWIGDDVLHLALPDRRRLRGPLDLRALRSRRPRGDGFRVPVHRRRHRRPPRGGPPWRGRTPLPHPRPGGARKDDGTGAHRLGR